MAQKKKDERSDNEVRQAFRAWNKEFADTLIEEIVSLREQESESKIERGRRAEEIRKLKHELSVAKDGLQVESLFRDRSALLKQVTEWQEKVHREQKEAHSREIEELKWQHCRDLEEGLSELRSCAGDGKEEKKFLENKIKGLVKGLDVSEERRRVLRSRLVDLCQKTWDCLSSHRFSREIIDAEGQEA